MFPLKQVREEAFSLIRLLSLTEMYLVYNVREHVVLQWNPYSESRWLIRGKLAKSP
jgi:hypothetical protein